MDVEKIMNRAYLLALAGAIAAAASLPLEAATYTFTGDGNWSDPANWQDGLLPTSDPAAHVIIAPTSTAAITSISDDAFPSWTINALTFNHTSNIVFDKQLNLIFPLVTDVLSNSPNSVLQFGGSKPSVENLSYNSATLDGSISSTTNLTLKGSLTVTASIIAPQLTITSANVTFAGSGTLPRVHFFHRNYPGDFA